MPPKKSLSKFIKNTLLIIGAGVLLYICALVAVFFAIKYGWTNTKGAVDHSFTPGTTTPVVVSADWAKGPEWQTFKEAISKDTVVINQVGKETGVSPRLIMSVVAVEQLRLYTSERELFKTIFAPLRLLGSQTQFSWGVAGLKEATAIQVESNLYATSSPYYLGPTFEHKLDFTSATTTEAERFSRLTDIKNHYYSYLYTALFIKQVEHAWTDAGYPIDQKPEILGTLFNIGFGHSKPKPEPAVGGAKLTIDGLDYSFGGLTYQIYNSQELRTEFPN